LGAKGLYKPLIQLTCLRVGELCVLTLEWIAS